jgi:hypothetical protein
MVLDLVRKLESEDFYARIRLTRSADLVLAAVDCDKALVATLRHEERLKPGTIAFIQAALLYSTPGGARRVRVHTLALPVASSIGAIFRGADLDTTLQARPPNCSPVISFLFISRRLLPDLVCDNPVVSLVVSCLGAD